jgi:hypothetical protein
MSSLGYQNNDRLEQEQLEASRAVIEEATKDTQLWVQANPSTDERVHVLAIQRLLTELARILERSMERRKQVKDDWVWSETVGEMLSRTWDSGERLPRWAPPAMPSFTWRRGLKPHAPGFEKSIKR